MSIVKGFFVSQWEGGLVKTSCDLDTATGELSTETVEVPNDLGCLESEHFESLDGEEIPVCSTCHEFIIEDGQCLNVDCDSRE
jgi:hypothetical protein